MDDRLQNLRRRLARVEAAISALKGTSASTADGITTVTAPFRVVDSNGKPVLEVVADKAGAYLCLVDPRGKPVVMLGADTRGGGLGISDARGEQVAALFAGQGGGQMDLSDRTGQRTAVLYATKAGGAMGLYSASGDTSVVLGATSTGGRVDVFDAAGEWAATVGAGSEGGAVTVVGPDGHAAASMTACERGGYVGVFDRNGNRAAELAAHERGGRADLFDRAESWVASLASGTEGGELMLLDSVTGKPLAALSTDLHGGYVATFAAQEESREKWAVVSATVVLCAVSCGLFRAVGAWDHWTAVIAQTIFVWWGSVGLGATLFVSLSRGEQWRCVRTARQNTFAMAAVVGLWIGLGGAPWWALSVLPGSALVEQWIFRRFLCRGSFDCIALRSWVRYLLSGELLGYLAGLWIHVIGRGL